MKFIGRIEKQYDDFKYVIGYRSKFGESCVSFCPFGNRGVNIGIIIRPMDNGMFMSQGEVRLRFTYFKRSESYMKNQAFLNSQED